MRIIAGAYRSRLLVSPPGTATRPTSDRLRESLFNILGPRVAGSRFVDLYAGTGAVGLEAISRGAAHCWFAENAAPALKSLRANLAALKLTQGFTVDERGAMPLLQKLASLPHTLDLVYVDPPYEAEEAYTQTLGFLGSPSGRKLLSAEAVVIAEHATRSRFPLAERYGGLSGTRVYKQGDSTLSFYEPSPPETGSQPG